MILFWKRKGLWSSTRFFGEREKKQRKNILLCRSVCMCSCVCVLSSYLLMTDMMCCDCEIVGESERVIRDPLPSYCTVTHAYRTSQKQAVWCYIQNHAGFWFSSSPFQSHSWTLLASNLARSAAAWFIRSIRYERKNGWFVRIKIGWIAEANRDVCTTSKSFSFSPFTSKPIFP